MIERRFGRIVNITSSAVKAPIAELGLSNGARSGLTGFIAGIARAARRAHNVTINNLLPGRFWTDRLRSSTEYNAKEQGKTVDEVRQAAREDDSGGPLRHAGRVRPVAALTYAARRRRTSPARTWLIDGGAYPGTY
jgi:3-oxoacyl-[acyl-carrier protein] reductase